MKFFRLRRLADPTICLTCRHARLWHEHYTDSTHCGVGACGCKRFR